MRIKVLELVYPIVVSCLAIVTNSKKLVLQETYLILSEEVVYTSKDNYRQNYLASYINTLDNCNLLTVTQLYSFQPASSLRSYKNQLYYNLAYYKASYIKVIDVFIYNTVLSLIVLYLLKLLLNYNRIFIESLLPIIQVIKTSSKIIYTLNKVIHLVDSNVSASALREQIISYLLYSSQIRSKSSLIQVQNTLNNCLLYYLGKLLRVGLAIASRRLASASRTQRSFRYFIYSCSLPSTLYLGSINR